MHIVFVISPDCDRCMFAKLQGGPGVGGIGSGGIHAAGGPGNSGDKAMHVRIVR